MRVAKFLGSRRRDWDQNPLIVSVVVCLLTPCAVRLVTSGDVNAFVSVLPGLVRGWLRQFLLNGAFGISLFAIIVMARNYVRAHLRLRQLIYTFAALILLFANCYFLTEVLDDRGIVHCAPGTPDWACAPQRDISLGGTYAVWSEDSQSRYITWRSMGLAYVDCFHYSVVTASTVGFGDMHPTRWYTKLVTDFQILLSLGLTVLAVSRFFSASSGGKTVTPHLSPKLRPWHRWR